MTATEYENPTTEASKPPTEVVETFLKRLREAARTRSVQAFVDLFHEEGWYREYVNFSVLVVALLDAHYQAIICLASMFAIGTTKLPESRTFRRSSLKRAFLI